MSSLTSPSSTSLGSAPRQVVEDWAERSCEANDRCLQELFRTVLATSAQLPPDQRLVMYDACDGFAPQAPLGPLRKRLDSRRNTKPKKAAVQLQVCTPFNPAGFHFGKIRNENERLLRLRLAGGEYQLLTNMFPLFPGHMLLVANELVPQQMRPCHLLAITELLQGCSGFSAYFNSWCASASVNHFHVHLIDEQPPMTRYPLVPGPHVRGQRCLQPEGFPGFCYVFEVTQLELVGEVVLAMQRDNQPHNALFTGRFIYLFPKPLQRPERSFELYPETVGGPELIGSFTVYGQTEYDAITIQTAEELTRMNTAPLPTRLLNRAALHSTPALSGVDDSGLGDLITARHRIPGVPGKIPASRTVDFARHGSCQSLMSLLASQPSVCAA